MPACTWIALSRREYDKNLYVSMSEKLPVFLSRYLLNKSLSLCVRKNSMYFLYITHSVEMD